MFYSRSSYLSLPEKPGVYLFHDEHNRVIYVGKAKNLKSRVSSYFTGINQLGEKTRALVEHIEKIKIVIVESELESLLLEAYYIKKYTPKYNIRLTDSKSYLLIRITIKEAFPAILLARRMDDPNSLYFGPYPSSQAIKTVLKTIRRVFPFMSTKNHPNRLCLYNHLGLCPCLPVHNDEVHRKEYRKNIKQIIRILEGDSQKIMKELQRERDLLSKAEQFEEALVLQKRVDALSYITQPFYNPVEYDVNPNLREDIRQKELSDLRKILEHHGYHIDQPLRKIECYDISHIQGTNTTASLVVFVDGEKESSLYRKFKIRLKKTPDDFASMREVLTRRLKHTEWEYPQLLVIDGGKGQVSAALEVLNEHNLDIPMIGLAKRIETIVIPNNHPRVTVRHAERSEKFPLVSVGAGDSSALPQDNQERVKTLRDATTGAKSKGLHPGKKEDNFTEVVLPHSLGALQLLQRLRDEAHRFAITYHRKLRSKAAVAAW